MYNETSTMASSEIIKDKTVSKVEGDKDLHENVSIRKPAVGDLDAIRNILAQWNEAEDVEKYVERIANEIAGKTEFGMHFWVAREGEKAAGVVGLSSPLPKILKYAKTDRPGEVKILYFDNARRGKGYGKILLEFAEKEAERKGYKEIILRSAKRYEDTAYGFYDRMGYARAGKIETAIPEQPMQVFEKVL